MNQVAIITGASRGIGKVVTKRFLEEGYSVVICSRKKDDVKKACKELDPKGKKLKGIVADVSNIKDCKKLIAYTLKYFKKIDVLVNNAGVYGPIGPLEENNLKEWTNAISVNLIGAVNCSHEIIPLFKKQKHGKIINMAGAGIGGRRALARFSSYYTSKGAVAYFTEVLASELVDFNIQVNCIAPGAVNTFLTDTLLKNGKEKAGEYMYAQALKQKESGGDSPELAADLITFLASKDADHISGKLLSAKWDKKELLKKNKTIPGNKFTLRRIDDELFYEK